MTRALVIFLIPRGLTLKLFALCYLHFSESGNKWKREKMVCEPVFFYTLSCRKQLGCTSKPNLYTYKLANIT